MGIPTAILDPKRKFRVGETAVAKGAECGTAPLSVSYKILYYSRHSAADGR